MTSTLAVEKDATIGLAQTKGRWPRSLLGRQAVGEARPMVWLTAVEGGARILSFGFYLVAARMFSPGGFGVVQYTITVSLLAFGALQVLTTALLRELGAVRGDRDRTCEVLGSSLSVAGALWVVTSVMCLVAKGLGLAHGANTVGLLAALGGTTAFQIYYAIARALGDPGRQAASYAGASLAQLLMVGGLAVLSKPTPGTALVIFGGSSLVPIVLYEWRSPVLRGRSLRIRGEIVRRLWHISAPLLLAQVCYLVWNSLDQLWVQGTLGTYQVGLYAAAKNVSLGLLIVPSGVCGVLLPRVAQLRSAGNLSNARRLIVWGTSSTILVSAVVAAMIALLRMPLLGELYGHSYQAASGPLVALSFGMVCFAGFESLTMAAIGWGRPSLYTAGVAVAALAEVLILILIRRADLMTAALAYAGSMGGAFLFVLVLLRIRPLWEVRHER